MSSVDGIEHTISRLEEALERQENTEGEIAATPTVFYCFVCDEISVDSSPQRCHDHPTVSSDGHEHAGIQAALTTLHHLQGDSA